MRLSPVPIGIRMGVCGGDYYRELRRIHLLETVWKIGEGLSARLTGGKRRPNSDFFDPSCPLSEPPFGTDPAFPNSFSRDCLIIPEEPQGLSSNGL
jgi:hypothetical protein